MDKTKLLDKAAAAGEERLLLAKILDRLEQSRSRNIPVCTDFLSPQEQASAMAVVRLAGIREDGVAVLGGYPNAERRVLLFLPDWLEPSDAEGQVPIRCLRAQFRPEYELSHRDFLGSLMGLGIVREKIGDILVGRDSCDLIVLDSVAEFLLQNWEEAGRARLTVSAIEPADLQVPEVKIQELRDTVMTLRLDAVASTGFQMSRSKAAALIEGGKVQVNWRDCVKPDRLLTQGDTVSARGFGKFELTEVGGVSRKGRTSIVLKRYV